MATNGKLTQKQISQWFDELDFEQQRLALGSFNETHSSRKKERLIALRREIAALERREDKHSGNGKSKGKAKAASVKYRDLKTGETWSGRGRMATWLATKVKAGEKLAKYLVK